METIAIFFFLYWQDSMFSQWYSKHPFFKAYLNILLITGYYLDAVSTHGENYI